jgi:hypothetical protein|nr:MAG TPA: hypothetical protein [Caudoviricetes sp.]
MGGRGSASSGAGAGAGGASAGGSIKSLEAQKKALGDRMASLVRQTDKDGQMTSEARKEYYATKSKRDDVVQKLSKAYKADAEARSKQAKSEPVEKKTFVNGYGEATHREITSSTYERAQKRSMKSVEGWLTGYRTRSGRK